MKERGPIEKKRGPIEIGQKFEFLKHSLSTPDHVPATSVKSCGKKSTFQQCASVETSGILERKKLSMSVAIVAADAPNNSQQMAPASCYH